MHVLTIKCMAVRNLFNIIMMDVKEQKQNSFYCLYYLDIFYSKVMIDVVLKLYRRDCAPPAGKMSSNTYTYLISFSIISVTHFQSHDRP